MGDIPWVLSQLWFPKLRGQQVSDPKTQAQTEAPRQKPAVSTKRIEKGAAQHVKKKKFQ